MEFIVFKGENNLKNQERIKNIVDIIYKNFGNYNNEIELTNSSFDEKTTCIEKTYKISPRFAIDKSNLDNEIFITFYGNKKEYKTLLNYCEILNIIDRS